MENSILSNIKLWLANNRDRRKFWLLPVLILGIMWFASGGFSLCGFWLITSLPFLMLSSNHRKFWSLLALFVFVGSIFILNLSDDGSYKMVVGLIMVFSFMAIAVFAILGLLLKIVFNLIFNRSYKYPVLISCLSATAVVITLIVTRDYKISSIFDFDASIKSFLVINSSFIFFSILVLLMSALSRLFKINQPNIWKFNLAPIILTSSLVMIFYDLIFV